MAERRPTITNFAAGVLDSKYEGRVDLPIYSKSAKEILNFFVDQAGYIYRRGGMKFIADSGTPNSKLRLIPWSIGNNLDILIVMSNGKIKLLNVTAGTTPGWVMSGASPFEITSLSSDSSIATYSESDLNSVSYAQTIGKIVLVHENYRPFYIKYNGINIITSELEFQYGPCNFTGNIAYSKEVGTASLDTTPISHNYFISLMRVLATYDNTSATNFAATGLINGKTVTNIRKVVASQGRRVMVTAQRGFLWPADDDQEHTVYDGTPWVFSDNDFKTNDGYRCGPTQDISLFSFDGDDSGTSVLDKCAANLMGDGTLYEIWKNGVGYWIDGTFRYYAASSSLSIVITFNDATTLTVTSGGSEAIAGYIAVPLYNIAINKPSIPGHEILDRIIPWMTPDVPYLCSEDSLINGSDPVLNRVISATKTIERVISPYTGNYAEESVLRLEFAGGTPVFVRRSTTDITGKVGVILTPYYEPNDNPGVVCYHQSRLAFGGSKAEPNVIYMSKTNDDENFSLFEEVEYSRTNLLPASDWLDPTHPETETVIDIIQQIGASSAIRLQLRTEEDESINSMASVSDLIIATSTSEWIFPAGLDATNARLVMTTRNGSARVQSRFVGDSLVLVSRSKHGMRSFAPDGTTQSPDITRHAAKLFKSKIVSFDFRQDPWQGILAVQEDGGVVAAPTGGDVPSWSQVKTSAGDLIEGLAVIADSDEDAIYVVVKRTVNSAVVRSIERIVTNDNASFQGRNYLDYSSFATSSALGIAGLARFYQGGAVHPSVIAVVKKASDGSEIYGVPNINALGVVTEIEVDALTTYTLLDGDVCLFGIPYKSRAETFRIDSMETEGMIKSSSTINIRVHESGSFTLKKTLDATYTDLIGGPNDPRVQDRLGARVYPYSGQLRTAYEGNRTGPCDLSVLIETEGHEPLGVQVISLMIDIAEAP